MTDTDTEVRTEEQTPLSKATEGNGLDRSPDPEVEQEARKLGWKPPEEWRGEPPKNGFESAAEYLERANRQVPLLRKQLDTERQARIDLERRLDRQSKEHAATVRDIQRMSKVALDTQREQIEARYDGMMERAVESGDTEAFRQARREKTEAMAKIDERLRPDDIEADKTTKTADAELPPAVKATVDGWITENSWFVSDAEMSALANAYHARLLREKPGLTLVQNLEAVRKYVAKRFPERFDEAEGEDVESGEERPVRRSPVEGGSRMAGAGGGRSLYSKLPADAKAQADAFIKQDGLFLERGETPEKDLAKARERYAQKYFEGTA